MKETELMRIRALLAAIVAAFFASFILAAAPASARDATAIGGTGGGQGRVECPAGQVIVGFFGNAGYELNRLSILCQNIDATFKWKGAAATSATLLGHAWPTLKTQSVACNPNGYVSQIDAWSLVTPTIVADLTIHCRDAASEYLPVPHASVVREDTSQTTSASASSTCNPDEIATGIYGRQGDAVDQVGLVCTLVTDVYTVAMGGSVGGGSPGSGSFIGTWDTKTSLGDRFSLVMKQNGPNISGVYTRLLANGKVDKAAPVGQFTAVPDGAGGLVYNWQIGKDSGAGTWTIAGDKIDGKWGAVTDHPEQVVGSWTGMRIVPGGGSSGSGTAFIGTWQTTVLPAAPGDAGGYTLTLYNKGSGISGDYVHTPPNGSPNGHLDGNIDSAGALKFDWGLGPFKGAGRFTVSGNNLNGVWGGTPGDATKVVGSWTGTKIGAAAGGSSGSGGSSGGSVTISIGGVKITISN